MLRGGPGETRPLRLDRCVARPARHSAPDMALAMSVAAAHALRLSPAPQAFVSLSWFAGPTDFDFIVRFFLVGAAQVQPNSCRQWRGGVLMRDE